MYSPLTAEESQQRQVRRGLRDIVRTAGRLSLWQGSKLVRPSRALQISFVCLLLLSGALLHALFNAFTIWMAIDPFDVLFASFPRERGIPSAANNVYSANYFRSVLPVPCHSHNDYWRTTPLFAALGSGCVSVEADVWLRKGELYVSHTGLSLVEGNTLSNLYIQPLQQILHDMNTGQGPATKPAGVFHMNPAQSLTLVVDFKTASDPTLPALHAQLQPLRSGGWLTHWNGTARVERPVIVVASGAVDFDALTANATYRDVFFDAPLAALADASDSATDFVASDGGGGYTTKYNPSNSHLASAGVAGANTGGEAERLDPKVLGHAEVAEKSKG
ncbi:hypothetical protein MPH_01382 [Macrophomina phaseolina MS6]|uniref:Altered inheritance of mitochondria protein 6 n=1 Tax=Macrophomina phaseolina (strain MS6) TaxID=1126212 RepID=K2SXU6_MACPH|nr:hypothetical protein MPH_01382 [Macrophomina phaseolina MS6]